MLRIQGKGPSTDSSLSCQYAKKKKGKNTNFNAIFTFTNILLLTFMHFSQNSIKILNLNDNPNGQFLVFSFMSYVRVTR